MFVLSKWYLDATTDAGEVFIGETGHLHWPQLHVHYSTLLRGSLEGACETASSFRFTAEPETEDDRITWNHSELGIDGEWKRSSVPLNETVYASTEGVVDWHCTMPRADVRLTTPDAGLRCTSAAMAELGPWGLGYVEHLRVTVAPWRLPIEKLRWGRFLTGKLSIVWMDWSGSYHRRLVYRNCRREHVEQLDDHRIRFDDGSVLWLNQVKVLRSGPIGATAVHSIPALKACCPKRLLAVDETEWLSKGMYESAGEPAQMGWAIHRRVLWPQDSPFGDPRTEHK